MHVDQAMKGGSDEDSPRRPSRGPPRGRGGLRGKPRGFGGGGRGGSRFGGDRGGSRFGGDRGGSRFGGDRRFGRGPPDRLGKRPAFGGRGKPPRGRGGRIGRDGPVPRRDSFGDRGDRMRDSRGPPPRGLDSRGPPRGLDSRGPPPRGLDSHGPPNRGPRDDDRGYGMDRMDHMDSRDRYGGGMDRGPPRSRDPFSSSPPRSAMLDSRNDSSYRDYSSRAYSPPPSRDFGPPRDRGPSSRMFDREYGSSRDMGGPTSRPFGSSGRDSFSSRDMAPPRDEYLSRDMGSSREYRDSISRDYGSSRDVGSRGPSRDFDRGPPPSRDYDSYRDSARISGPPSRSFGPPGSPRDGPPATRGSGGPPSRSFGASSSTPRSLMGMGDRGDRDRDRDRDRGGRDGYSVGSRRPAPYDSRGPPPMKRPRPDGPPPFRR
ncbi:hypothetical protein CHS0354_020558 [Potamilus streckersoni]|uniref:Uncharacterized protein n=2 Tax=Potamilus streckersoni TaxID=2493646 RepID=A0AAE0VYR8_9BIVA|nr:hypothetical protein CHS0354_020558 [Potamilus streckersoni]